MQRFAWRRGALLPPLHFLPMDRPAFIKLTRTPGVIGLVSLGYRARRTGIAWRRGGLVS